MAISKIVVCDKNKIQVLRNLPDCCYPVCAVLTADTVEVIVRYDKSNPNEPAHIDASAACRALGCFPSDLVMVDWNGDIGDVYGGAPWVHDNFDAVCVSSSVSDDIRVVSDFCDLF